MQPRETYESVGHSAAEALLLRAIDQHRLPHTLLFSGQQGIGKATFAYRLIRYMLQRDTAPSALFGPADMHTDPDSPVNARIAANSHADLLVIEPELSGQNQTPIIKVETIRKIAGFFSMTAAESGWRIVLIDGADALNINAANALLKAMEEPPKNALVILISHNTGRLLPTIRSRCFPLRFQPLSALQFHQVLRQYVSDENERNYLYHLTQGAPGAALQLSQQGAAAYYDDVLSVLSGLTETNTLISRVEKHAKSGSFPLWCDMWQRFLERLNRHANDPTLRAINQQEQACFSHLLASKPGIFWSQLYSESQRLIRDAQALHLERKQVIHSLVAMAQGQQALALPD